MITPRQNLLDLFRRKQIHYAVPQFELCPAMVDKVEKKFGTRDYPGHFEFPVGSAGCSLLKQNFSDWRRQFFPDIDFLPGTAFDLWGIAHESTPESMHMSKMYHPMERFTSREEFAKYPYPEIDDAQFPALRSRIAKLHEQGLFVSESMQCTIWETAWYMRGMEEMMIGMMTDDENTADHLDRITDLACRRARAYAEAEADLIFLGDDIGMQHTIMMSETLYREWLKPRLARVVSAARSQKPDVLIAYHSCGFVEPSIADLIEVGVDVLNPVQPECMNFSDIYAKYGDRLSFWGTLGTQRLFPFGTPEEVYDETLRNLRIAGARGGLLATPTHLVEPEVPLENLLAYVRACHDFIPGN